ncbi:glycerate kinase [Stackebrandtia nassauensis]|uniref:Glycerate kinase n=1 Tax=Stackebrandtia nassauensis (strain DSM 44728 / CIP 108903 / NRRL B-16338 / NBRC 102104 / LLR-40K-21) TaxID=446470 RepID=D3Q655_STANL|nr:glycerate kinase [Stackebrandtia nassauensis]ADD42230.1 glycerate kinase [Stackebrandtia nassauensis DSM 44728]
MRRVVVAPDKFKGSLSAAEVAAHLAAGLRTEGSDVECVPVADGGDGTVAAMVTSGYQAQWTRVTGPLGALVDAMWASSSSGAAVAVVELAQASGLVLSPRPLDALRASSRGTGELLRAARDSGARHVVLGVGGSACTDGGAGMLQALGVRLLDANGRDLPPGGAALRDLASIDAAEVPDAWRDIEVTVACDVDNPLLGPNGAAAVYGPQKGASPSDVAVLEAGLARFAEVVRRDLGVDVADSPGAGAAGGVAYGVLAFLDARLRSGIELVLSLVDFDKRLVGADLVITGEGRLDTQTMRGKAPAGVAAAATRAGVPTIAVSGVCELTSAQLVEAGFTAAYQLSDLEPDLQRSIRDAGPLLERIATHIAADLLAAPAHNPTAPRSS